MMHFIFAKKNLFPHLFDECIVLCEKQFSRNIVMLSSAISLSTLPQDDLFCEPEDLNCPKFEVRYLDVQTWYP